jgi:hypothetical protein
MDVQPHDRNLNPVRDVSALIDKPSATGADYPFSTVHTVAGIC